MKFLKSISVIVFLWSLMYCTTIKNSAEKESLIKSTIVKPVVKIKDENFPKNWVGKYNGELQIYAVDSIRMTANMRLDISKKNDSIYNWTITYLINNKEDVRAYELKIVNSKKGKYLIDEKNSIKIDAFYHHKIFTSFFKVMDSFVVATYTQKKDAIVFEIISASNKNKKITGNTKYNDEDIPQVISYFVNGRQKAVLKKME